MPVYCYRTKRGTFRVERVYSMRAVPRTIRVRGRTLYRDIAAEHGGFRNTPGIWPMASDAAGVHPSQIAEAMAEDRRNGVPTDYTRDGRPILRDPDHYKRYMEANGLFARNSYGGRGEPRRLGAAARGLPER